MAIYRKKQIIEALQGIVEISEPQLAYYLKLGIVTPDVANPSGRAETKYHSAENLVDIVIARELEDAGLSLKAIKGVMDSVRKEVRNEYKQLKDSYRLQIIVANPNLPGSWAKLQKCLKKNLQRIKNPVDPGKVALDMDAAKSYTVIDITTTIQKMAHLL